jgi:3-oxoacyl-[acyl-carrier-protein] synthase-3
MNKLTRNVKIIGTGSFTPETIYTNKQLEKMVDTNEEWIEKNLGIKERRIARFDEFTSDLAAKAALSALSNANLVAEKIDLIIVATATPDRLAPSTAVIVQDKIQAYHAAAFDISAVCTGFIYALSTASQFIASGTYDYVLVIGADTFSKITDWTRRDAVFFGDGAGAVVLTHGEEGEGLLSSRLYADGRGKWTFTIPAGGSEMPASVETLEKRLHYFQMNGHGIYEAAIEVLPIAINQVLKDAELSIDDIDFMIPHQPSIKILQKTAEKVGLPWEKVMTNMDKYANTCGGTIPILLDEVNRAGKLKKGDLILLAAVGSGMAYGASVLKWS